LYSTDCFKEYFVLREKRWHRAFVPDHLRASGIGWYNTTVGVLQLIESLVAGWLWDRVGHVAVFYYGAALAVVGALSLWLLVNEIQDRRAHRAA
jgi:MFS family permease